jgi:hypothetical protein
VKSGSRCSKCGAQARKRLYNVFRSSTVCEDRECQTRERNWVGNLPHTPTIPPNSWAHEKRRPPEDRSRKVGSRRTSV